MPPQQELRAQRRPIDRRWMLLGKAGERRSKRLRLKRRTRRGNLNRQTQTGSDENSWPGSSSNSRKSLRNQPLAGSNKEIFGPLDAPSISHSWVRYGVKLCLIAGASIHFWKSLRVDAEDRSSVKPQSMRAFNSGESLPGIAIHGTTGLDFPAFGNERIELQGPNIHTESPLFPGVCIVNQVR